MIVEAKEFQDLSLQELYAILQLRSAVFVVEQDCVYQDIDGKDNKALHILGKKEGVLVAYTRIFAPGDYADLSSIGRVVVNEADRKYGYGKVIMEESIKKAIMRYKVSKIEVSAQTYLLKFYKELGFVEEGKEYLEDGIPHIRMILTS